MRPISPDKWGSDGFFPSWHVHRLFREVYRDVYHSGDAPILKDVSNWAIWYWAKQIVADQKWEDMYANAVNYTSFTSSVVLFLNIYRRHSRQRLVVHICKDVWWVSWDNSSLFSPFYREGPLPREQPAVMNEESTRGHWCKIIPHVHSSSAMCFTKAYSRWACVEIWCILK